MLNIDGTSSKGSDEIDICMVEEVIVFSLESGVRLLFNLKDDIARQNTRCLVSLSIEFDLVAAPDTSVDMDVKDLSLNNGLLAIAALAPILLTDDLAFTTAVGADGLESLDHGAHLAHHGLHTVSIASSALLDSTLLATTSITLGADYGLLQSELGDLASIDILEGNFVGVVDGASLGRTALLHSSTEHAPQATAECGTSSEEL